MEAQECIYVGDSLDRSVLRKTGKMPEFIQQIVENKPIVTK